MKIITGKTGTAHYQAADNASFNKGIISESNFVLKVGKRLVAELKSNNIVRIQSGDIVYRGVHARVLEYEDVQIQNGAQGVNRTDVIVARYAIDTRTGIESVSLVAIKGNPNIPATPLPTDMLLYTVALQGVNIISVKSNFLLLMGLKELNDLITSTRSNLEGKINTNYNTLNSKINTNYNTLNSKIDSNVSGINSKISTNANAINTKLNKTDVVNNLTTTAAGKALDARQGKTVWDNLITARNNVQNGNAGLKFYSGRYDFNFAANAQEATGTINLPAGKFSNITAVIAGIRYTYGSTVSVTSYTASNFTYRARRMETPLIVRQGSVHYLVVGT